MTRYPRRAGNARLHCDACGSPVVKRADSGFVCVDCGAAPAE
ncbi:hypothetical protein [Halosimplex marinum]